MDTQKTNKKNLKEKLAKARAKAAVDAVITPKALDAFYDKSSGKITVTLNNEVTFSFPYSLAQGLEGASEEELNDIEISPSGEGLHWESLDADLSIPCLLQGIFGTRHWMAQIGKKGGTVTSPSKVAAARENGLKGGRPRKQPAHSSIGL